MTPRTHTANTQTIIHLFPLIMFKTSPFKCLQVYYPNNTIVFMLVKKYRLKEEDPQINFSDQLCVYVRL